MGGPVRAQFQPPSVHYAMIYLDPAGKIVVSESPSIQEENVTIFTSAVKQSFLDIVQPKIGYQAPVHPSTEPSLSTLSLTCWLTCTLRYFGFQWQL